MNCLSRLVCLAFLLGAPAARAQDVSQAASKPPMTLLFKSIWRVTKAKRQPFHGSIYIFLPDGTLLETSCGEPYRVALWSRDSQDPSTLRITEDQRVVSTWRIVELTSTTLHLEKKLVRSEEKDDETLTAVKQEFVCPDLPK
jgi:hypothetical protein